MTAISVLIAVHESDQPVLLDQALQSLEQQTLPAGEVVVIEDGPLTVELYNTLDQCHDRLPLRRMPLGASNGLGSALSLGLERCRNELVARMDADDISEPERLSEQSQAFADEPKLSVLGSQATVIDEGSRPIGQRHVPCSNDAIYKQIWACPFIHPAVMFRRTDILRVGNYNPKLRTRQDHELWYRCAAAGLHMRNLPSALLRYRESSQPKNKRFSVVLQHVKINLTGCYRVGVGLKGWVGAFAPLVLFFVPRSLADAMRRRLKFTDPH